MYPLVHSPTQTTLKSKWNTFKEWFTPDLSKRRPSQCSTTSTNTTLSNSTTTSNNCCCSSNTDYTPTHNNNKKRPSISTSIQESNMLDKCMSPFRRRPSTASQCSSSTLIEQQQSTLLGEIEKLFELYHFAMDEINYAEDSQGSPYYQGDKIAAKEAIEHCIHSYELLLNKHQFDNSSIGYKITFLQSKFDNLPPLLENDSLLLL